MSRSSFRQRQDHCAVHHIGLALQLERGSFFVFKHAISVHPLLGCCDSPIVRSYMSVAEASFLIALLFSSDSCYLLQRILGIER